MNSIDRRQFLAASISAVSAASLTSLPASAAEGSQQAPGIVDTNVNLFEYPFRRLKYRDPNRLAGKLKKHRITQAWAGSFEALFSKDINGVNERLAAECKRHAGFLIPFGTVNLAWPDWEEDLRRCQEVHKMPGIRIYPGYQPFDLAHKDMAPLLKLSSERDLILQIVFGIEDPRVHHPIIKVEEPSLKPLLKALQAAPNAKVELLHFGNGPQGSDLAEFLSHPNTYLETSRFEGNGAIGRMLGSIVGLPSARAPIDRILFGSHAPYFPVETALLKLIESPLNLAELDSLMQTNAGRLLPAAKKTAKG